MFADDAAWICALEIQPQFDGLDEKEKAYAHWMSRAAFLGTRIILRQNAPRADGIFDLILHLYRYCHGDWTSLAAEVDLEWTVMQYFIDYAAMFLTNYGNFTAFSGQKFFPRLSRSEFEKLAGCSVSTKTLFKEVMESIYSDHSTILGYPNAELGQISGYYPDSADFSQERVQRVQDFLESHSIPSENTRLRRLTNSEGQELYELNVASATLEQCPAPFVRELHFSDSNSTDAVIRVHHGDHASELTRINDAIRRAKDYAANDLEVRMLDEYMDSFSTGSIQAHKEAQGLWVKDSAPIVETMLGFIEYYRDPHSVRAEWRGFVMIQNKKESKYFQRLLDHAEKYIGLLPWNQGRSDFELDVFTKPDFTSMEALTFVSTSIPAGTNGPNYPDVRRSCGFKNLAIRNRVIDTPAGNVSFLSQDDSRLYAILASEAFGMQVALHELLGHGSGKDLAETSAGCFNFDRGNPPMNPLTGRSIESWYTPGQSWKPLFGSSYEECRCECVALFLSLNEEVMQVFDYELKNLSSFNVAYVGFVYLIRQGLIGLETWNPKSRTWGKAHARARYAIMRYLMTSEPPLVTVSHAKDREPELLIQLDRENLRLHGQRVISDLLLRFHVFKSTADSDVGMAMYNQLSEVDSQMEEYREIIVKKSTPRKQFVQANTVMIDGEVLLKEYKATGIGIIQSWAERDV